MCNKFFQVFICFICIVCFVSCDQSSSQENKIVKKRIGFDFKEGNITISDEQSLNYKLQIEADSGIRYSTTVCANQVTPIRNIFQEYNETLYDIAFKLAQNNGCINLNIRVDDLLDTTVIYNMPITNTPQYSTNVLQGTCAKLSSSFDAQNIDGDIIKWLFRKNLKNVDDETICNMRAYLQELNFSGFKEYVTQESIPVITSFQGINYNISSDLVADNYYLFACKSETEIEEFVEEMVSIKFDGAIHTLSQRMPCYRAENGSGNMCIFLIGINNDWNYRIVPIGLVCIDNIKPFADRADYLKKTYGVDYESNKSDCSKIIISKEHLKVRFPDNIPTVQGYAFLDTKDWHGNQLSCNVIFEVEFGGDIKSLTLVREGNFSKWIGKGKKVIDLQNEISPYIFTYELHLEIGDNYLPVILTDLSGNITEFKFNIETQDSNNDSPQINIDNKVNVFN